MGFLKKRPQASKSQKTTIPYLKSRTRPPLLFIFIPLGLGYSLGRYYPQPSLSKMVIFAIFLLGLFLIAWLKNYHKTLFFRVIGTAAIILIAWSYYIFKQPPSINSSHVFTEREVTVSLKVSQTFDLKDQSKQKGGYGIIVKAPKHLEWLLNQGALYHLKTKYADGNIHKSTIIEATGIISPLNEQNTFESYLKTQGIQFKIKRGQITAIHPGNPFFKFFSVQNKNLTEILQKSFKNENSATGIYIAMLLGRKTELTDAQKKSFAQTGSLHLLAISGLHIVVIGGALAIFFKYLRIPSLLSATLGLSILFLYVEITGGYPSAMRAFWMIAFYWSARAFSRKKCPFSALLGSALLALIITPNLLWNIGFQLSYAVVAALLLWGLPLNEWIHEQLTRWLELRKIEGFKRFWIQKIFMYVIGLVNISYACMLVSTPLSILYFHNLAPGALLLSLILIPLSSIIMVTGLIAMISGLLMLKPLTLLLNTLAHFLISLMEACINTSLKMNYLFWDMEWATAYQGAILTILLLAWAIFGHFINALRLKRFYIGPLSLIVIWALFFTKR